MDTDAEANFGQQAIGGDCFEADIDEGGCMNLEHVRCAPSHCAQASAAGLMDQGLPRYNKSAIGFAADTSACVRDHVAAEAAGL